MESKISIEDLNKHISDKYIVKQKHPNHDLFIYNYTPKCQYERYWNELTLKCRGLVLNGDGRIIAKSFDKFFNLEELSDYEVPKMPFKTYLKFDGSLIIMFMYHGEWIFASRGSFASEQAIRAKEIFDKKYSNKHINKDYTYVFELIYPENRIVCNYGDREELILLSVVEDRFFEELHNDLHSYGKLIGCNIAKELNYKNLYELKSIIKDDEEGFVIRFDNGFRCKIKGDEYCRLHKIVKQISTKTVWEYLSTEKDFDELLDKVPDEFYNWVKTIKSELNNSFLQIENVVFSLYHAYLESLNQEKVDRKTYSNWANSQDKNIRSILYKLYDQKHYGDIIWKMIEPKFEKPFNNKKKD